MKLYSFALTFMINQIDTSFGKHLDWSVWLNTMTVQNRLETPSHAPYEVSNWEWQSIPAQKWPQVPICLLLVPDELKCVSNSTLIFMWFMFSLSRQFWTIMAVSGRVLTTIKWTNRWLSRHWLTWVPKILSILRRPVSMPQLSTIRLVCPSRLMPPFTMITVMLSNICFPLIFKSLYHPYRPPNLYLSQIPSNFSVCHLEIINVKNNGLWMTYNL